MLKHIILWQLHSHLSPEEKLAAKEDIRSSLEALAGQIPGLLTIRVHTQPLDSSNADVMLDSSFTDAQALAAYAVHPLHVAAADAHVRPYTANRVCMDYITD